MSDRALAERLVRLAGGIALELRGGAVEVKGDATDVVTEADRRAEAAQLALLRAERPATACSGRRARRWPAARGGGCSTPSTGRSTTRAGCRRGARRSCCSTAAGPLACAAFDPVADELFSAARGEGATLGGAPLRVARAAAARGRGRRHVRRRPPPRARRSSPAPRRCCAASARCGRSAAARSSSPGSRRAACTAGSRPASSRGTGIRARCSSPRPAASRASPGTWHVAAAGPALADELDAAVT